MLEQWEPHNIGSNERVKALFGKVSLDGIDATKTCRNLNVTSEGICHDKSSGDASITCTLTTVDCFSRHVRCLLGDAWRTDQCAFVKF